MSQKSQKYSESSLDTLPHPKDTPKIKAGHSSVIVSIMWIFLILYSLLASYVAKIPWWTMILHYMLTLISFYIWHWQCHQQYFWNKTCYQTHKIHHWQLYPPEDFFGETEESKQWKIKTKKTWVNKYLSSHEGFLYILSLLQAYVAFTITQNYAHLVFYLIQAGLIAIIGVLLHQSFHVKGIFLERYEWFHELRAMHYIHHLGNAKQNYAVLNLGLDQVFGSFLSFDPDKKAQQKTLLKQSLDELLKHIDESDLKGIKKEKIKQVFNAGIITQFGSFFNPVISLPEHHDESDIGKQQQQSWAVQRGVGPVLVRVILVGGFLVFWWQVQQQLINFHNDNKLACQNSGVNYYDNLAKSQFITVLHDIISPFSDKILVLLMNFFFVFMSFYVIFGRTIRPLIAVCSGYIFRKFVDMCIQVCGPQHSNESLQLLWGNYNFVGDQIICGMMAFITIGAIELTRTLIIQTDLKTKLLILLGSSFILLIALVALIGGLYVNTAGVIIGLAIGRLATLISARYAPYFDYLLP